MSDLFQRNAKHVFEATSQLQDIFHKLNEATKENPMFAFWKQRTELVKLLLHKSSPLASPVMMVN